jgi:hypothetical protein
MAHHNFSMLRLLSTSMSQYRRNNEKNHYIIATSSTMLSKTRTEILTSDIRRIIRVLRPWGYKMSFPVPGQNGYRLPASPVTASPSPEQRESRLFNTSRPPSLHKPRFSDPIGVVRMQQEECKAEHGRLRKRVWLPPAAGPWCNM